MQDSVPWAEDIDKLKIAFNLKIKGETDAYTNKCDTLWFIQGRSETQKMVWSVFPGLVGVYFSEYMEAITLK